MLRDAAQRSATTSCGGGCLEQIVCSNGGSCRPIVLGRHLHHCAGASLTLATTSATTILEPCNRCDGPWPSMRDYCKEHRARSFAFRTCLMNTLFQDMPVCIWPTIIHLVEVAFYCNIFNRDPCSCQHGSTHNQTSSSRQFSVPTPPPPNVHVSKCVIVQISHHLEATEAKCSRLSHWSSSSSKYSRLRHAPCISPPARCKWCTVQNNLAVVLHVMLATAAPPCPHSQDTRGCGSAGEDCSCVTPTTMRQPPVSEINYCGRLLFMTIDT